MAVRKKAKKKVTALKRNVEAKSKKVRQKAATATKKAVKTTKKVVKKTRGLKKQVTAKTETVKEAVKPKAKKFAMDFIGTFPLRRNDDDKKLEQKKVSIGPVFEEREIVAGYEDSNLGMVQTEDFRAIYLGKHSKDQVKLNSYPRGEEYADLIQALLNKEIDVAVVNMTNVPVSLRDGVVQAGSQSRQDPRDVLVTNAPYGAIQELPSTAKIACQTDRQVMQVKSLSPKLQIKDCAPGIHKNLELLEKKLFDAVLLPWASLKRLNISPRYYSALPVEHMVPAICQGIIGYLCRKGDKDMQQRLKIIDDSESSWASRCERAFLKKLGGNNRSAIGAQAHRKGTQDPWILEAIVGDATTGEILKYREIGTSRCKPESLADKAYLGSLARGARKFTPFVKEAGL